MPSRTCVIGLDCATPDLVFDRYLDRMPNLKRLAARGVYGPLESCTPPITVPAWMCMMTGKDPGELGIYGFRNRRDHSYGGLAFATSRLVHEPAVWDILGEHGKRSIALGVPLTYPPKPIHGLVVSDFLAPNTQADYTFPGELKDEIRSAVGEYILDTRDFRTDDKERLLGDIRAMTRQRFQLAAHLAAHHAWDLFMMVEMGPDRIHHGFWRYIDPKHRLYEAGNAFEDAIADYYTLLDECMGEFVTQLPPDTNLLVVSDHGAKRMDGAICFNEWLIEQGYLVLKERPSEVTKFSPEMVDWAQTRAWGDGGYYGRCFLNIEGREPQGTVKPGDAEALLNELAAKLEALGDEHGNPIGTRTFRPGQVYRACRNVPPDLIVYFGDLNWRSIGSVGHPSVWTYENDTGPDDANHAPFGIFLMGTAADMQRPGYVVPGIPREGLSLFDIAPTILSTLGVAVPEGVGRSAISTKITPASDMVYTDDEEAELARRLEDLGYL